MPSAKTDRNVISQIILNLVRLTPTTYILILPNYGAVLFFKGKPIALRTGSVVYFNCSPGTEQKAVNDLDQDLPHVRSSASQFDFIMGQLLTTTGIRLTYTSSEVIP